MWFGIASKKEVSREFKRVSESLRKKEDRLIKAEEEFKELKKEFISKKEIELMIKEIVLLSAAKPEPNPGLKPEPIAEPNQSNQTNYERVMVKRAIKTRPEVIKSIIRGLLDEDKRTTDIFRLVVEEKRLISKTQFYHYLSLVRNELRGNIRTELNPAEPQTKADYSL